MLTEQEHDESVEQAVALPLELDRLAISFERDVDVPECLGHKALTTVVLVDDKAERRELARTVADHLAIEHLEPSLQAHRLEPSEDCSDAKIELNPGFDRSSLAHVERDRILSGVVDLPVCVK